MTIPKWFIVVFCSISLFFYWLLGTFCPPVLVWLLKRHVKYYEKRNGDPNKLAYAKWLILHHQKAEWKQVVKVLEDIKNLLIRFLQRVALSLYILPT